MQAGGGESLVDFLFRPRRSLSTRDLCIQTVAFVAASILVGLLGGALGLIPPGLLVVGVVVGPGLYIGFAWLGWLIERRRNAAN